MGERNKEIEQAAEAEENLRLIAENGYRPGLSLVLDDALAYEVLSIDDHTGLIELKGVDVRVKPGRLSFPEGLFDEL